MSETFRLLASRYVAQASTAVSVLGYFLHDCMLAGAVESFFVTAFQPVVVLGPAQRGPCRIPEETLLSGLTVCCPSAMNGHNDMDTYPGASVQESIGSLLK